MNVTVNLRIAMQVEASLDYCKDTLKTLLYCLHSHQENVLIFSISIFIKYTKYPLTESNKNYCTNMLTTQHRQRQVFPLHKHIDDMRVHYNY